MIKETINKKNKEEAFINKLFISFTTTILEKCAKELGVTTEFLRAAYVSNPEVRNDLNNIFERHINNIGKVGA